MVGGSVCVTLGHGIQAGNDDVRAHEFFGSYPQVLQNLSLLPRDSNGLLMCAGIKRHPTTGHACAFVGNESFGARLKGRTRPHKRPDARFHEVVLPWVEVHGDRM